MKFVCYQVHSWKKWEVGARNERLKAVNEGMPTHSTWKGKSFHSVDIDSRVRSQEIVDFGSD